MRTRPQILATVRPLATSLAVAFVVSVALASPASAQTSELEPAQRGPAEWIAIGVGLAIFIVGVLVSQYRRENRADD